MPDSADELCAIAREVNGSDSDVYLGERATEETLKRLSKQRLLENYRVVDFASHALVAGMEGDTANIAEPGIVLTPPKSSDEGDCRKRWATDRLRDCKTADERRFCDLVRV